MKNFLYCSYILYKQAAQWTISINDHPIQRDQFNCGVFVINFIKCYLNHQVFNNKIQFETSPASLECDRHLISKAIEEFKII